MVRNFALECAKLRFAIFGIWWWWLSETVVGGREDDSGQSEVCPTPLFFGTLISNRIESQSHGDAIFLRIQRSWRWLDTVKLPAPTGQRGQGDPATPTGSNLVLLVFLGDPMLSGENGYRRAHDEVPKGDGDSRRVLRDVVDGEGGGWRLGGMQKGFFVNCVS